MFTRIELTVTREKNDWRGDRRNFNHFSALGVANAVGDAGWERVERVRDGTQPSVSVGPGEERSRRWNGGASGAKPLFHPSVHSGKGVPVEASPRSG